jgi:hypothetical protein
MSAVICSECGGDMEAETVNLPDGRQRFTLTCTTCGDQPFVEFTRRKLIEMCFHDRMVPIGYINVPADEEPDAQADV